MEFIEAYFNSSKKVRIGSEDGEKFFCVADIIRFVRPEKSYGAAYYLGKIDQKWVKRITKRKLTLWMVNVRGVADLLKVMGGKNVQKFTNWIIESVIPTYVRPTSQVETAVAEVVAEERKEMGVSEFVFPVTQTVIRTTMIDGKPWFVAKDVCEVLGLANITEAVRGLDDDEKQQLTTNIINPEVGGRGTLTINESGFYSLVAKSRKPQAKVFKRWVNHDVLPAIRKDGMYVMGEEKCTTQESLEELALRVITGLQAKIQRMSEELAFSEDKRCELESQTIELEKKAEVYIEKADRHDKFLATGGLIPVTQAAKVIGAPPRKLVQFMKDEDWLWQNGITPKQWVINRGYMETKVSLIPVGDFTKTHGYLTTRGMGKLESLWSKKMASESQVVECAV